MYPAAPGDGLPRQLLAGPIVTPPRDQPGDRRYLKPEMIDEVFGHHPPSSEVVGHVHTLIRAELRRAAHWLNDLLPEGPLKTTAINHLRDAMWAANAAVAVGQTPDWAEHAGRHVHFYDGEVIASYEAERRELAKLGQWFLRRGSNLLHGGSAVDTAIEHLDNYLVMLDRPEIADEAADMAARTLGDEMSEQERRRLAVTDEQAAEVVFQALGQAGLAWDEIPGVYRVEIAAAVGRDLLPKLGFTVPDGYQAPGGREAVARGLVPADEVRGETLDTLTRRAYAAYGDSVSWQNYQGLPMPQWPDLGEKTQRAWLSAVGAAVEMYRAMVRLQLVEPGEPVMPVRSDPPRFELAPIPIVPEPEFVENPEADDPTLCGVPTPTGRCALAVGHPVGPMYPGHDGHMSSGLLVPTVATSPALEAGEREASEVVPLESVAPPEVVERIDEFLERPETGVRRERPERTES